MTTETRTTCPYCGVGCGVIATRHDDGSVTVKGDPDHPSNYGRLCSKGSALGETLDMDGRLLYPEINGDRASWDSALDIVAEKFLSSIREHGPDSVAFYLSGQSLTEDYYVANKLMKGFIGSANVDTNSRLCMASSVAGHRRAFGSDTVPGIYEDLELADLIVLTGSNLAWCHPVIYQRIAAAKTARPHMKIVVIDPRRTMTCDIADMHLGIKPDADVALFNGLLAHLARSPAFNAAYVAAYTEGFDDALAAAKEQNATTLSSITGLSWEELTAFFELFERTEKVVTCYSQGVNQSMSGTDKVNAIINCHFATGRIGRPGMGPFSLTGQPNAMGGREVGGLANMLAAHLALENEDHRRLVQDFWKAPVMATRAGLKAVDMFQAVADGRIKALWIMSTNPVVSLPEADNVKAALAACPFVVVSDIQKNTDTAAFADVLLPALGWGEKDGTVTNSERRISRQRAFLAEPGEAMADWRQLAEVGRRIGFESAFAWEDASEVFSEHAALSALENNGTRDFDIGAHAAISKNGFDALTPFQWPQPANKPPVETRFFAEGGFYTPNRKGRFIAVRQQAHEIEPAYPFTLNTGRIRDQWHTMTRTGKSARLSQHIAEPFCEINPADAAELGVAPASLVKIESPHGTNIVRALVTPRQRRGSIFMPMHWTAQFASSARADVLVKAKVDPHSGQPALKQAGVSLKPFAAGAYGFAVTAEKPEHLENVPYWALARADSGWRIELGFDEPVEDWGAWCRNAFGLSGDAEIIGYTDRQKGVARLAFFEGEKLLAALYVATEPVEVSRNWAVAQLGKHHGNTRTRFAIAAGRPGQDQPDPGAIVCSCFSIGINQITSAIEAGHATVEAIGECTKAGTNCGSCRSEIRGMIHEHRLPAAAE
ncbi:nitrate reductase [Rhizobium sp. L1K21]|uniref:nitrate reductase n=1 Tax=Rhizobium sp. L1K21 TaxID=2954933 RepID=UPI002093AABC|nr:nitrate reductase [Rhizobium sp. L1K21]MCO6186941.1 molybdopterin-dependent oxidoreductase [Rhizobium sp. L1K21]